MCTYLNKTQLYDILALSCMFILKFPGIFLPLREESCPSKENLDIIARRKMNEKPEATAYGCHPFLFPVASSLKVAPYSYLLEFCPFEMFSLLRTVQTYDLLLSNGIVAQSMRCHFLDEVK